MWKLLIADDEAKIRRGLRALIERLELPVEIVCEAEDGQAALRAAQAARPDILLVDINMPFMGGLEFIQRLRGENQAARIIVVTGYEEFEYARRALELGVQAYLLKPVEGEELKRALRDAINELEASGARTRHYQWAIKQVERRREYLLERFWGDVLQGQYTEAEIREHMAHYGIPALEQIELMLIAVSGAALREQPWDTLVCQLACTDALRSVLAPCRYAQLFPDARGNVLLLCDIDQAQGEALKIAVEQAIEHELQAKANVLRGSVGSYSELADAYDGLLEALLKQRDCPPAVKAATEYIEHSLGKVDLGLEEVARVAGIDPSYLSKLMKQELGMPFAKYLTCVRINRAAGMMRDPQAKIKTIAEQVGYASPHYFSTAFKKMLGVAPIDYRSEEKSK